LVQLDAALLETVTLSESRGDHSDSVIALHDWESEVVDWSLVRAAIELLQRIFFPALSHFDDAGVDHIADPGGALTLDADPSVGLGPVNEVGAARVSGVAHIAEGQLSVD